MKIIKSAFLFIFLLSFLENNYSQEYIGNPKEIQKILANIENFSKNYINGDHEKIAAAYTADGKIMPSGSEIISGTKSLEKFWDLPEGVNILHHKVTPIELRIVKRIAYDYGYYEGVSLTKEGEKVPWKGKYVIIWKRIGKDWKIYLDIWNRIDEPKN